MDGRGTHGQIQSQQQRPLPPPVPQRKKASLVKQQATFDDINLVEPTAVTVASNPADTSNTTSIGAVVQGCNGNHYIGNNSAALQARNYVIVAGDNLGDGIPIFSAYSGATPSKQPLLDGRRKYASIDSSSSSVGHDGSGSLLPPNPAPPPLSHGARRRSVATTGTGTVGRRRNSLRLICGTKSIERQRSATSQDEKCSSSVETAVAAAAAVTEALEGGQMSSASAAVTAASIVSAAADVGMAASMAGADQCYNYDPTSESVMGFVDLLEVEKGRGFRVSSNIYVL